MLFVSFLLLLFGVVLVGTYDEGIWLLIGGILLLAAAVVISRFSVKKLRHGAQGGKTPFVWLIVSVVVLCASGVGLLVADPLASVQWRFLLS